MVISIRANNREASLLKAADHVLRRRTVKFIHAAIIVRNQKRRPASKDLAGLLSSFQLAVVNR